MHNYLPPSMEALVGCMLTRDVMTDNGVILLSANSRLSRDHLEKLYNLHIEITRDDVYNNTDIEEMNLAIIEDASEDIRTLFDSVRNGEQLPLQSVRDNIIPAVENAADNRNLFQLFLNLQARNDYTYRHAIGVGVISTLIGRQFSFSETELSELMLAATLHDIGKMKVPQEILDKPGKLTPEEYEIVKKHTIDGYEMLTNIPGITEQIAVVALRHHEREDGSGYPYGLKGHEIDLFSKIVAVADVFHAMTSNRVYHNAIPFYKVVRQMQEDVFGKLDYQVSFKFLEQIMGKLVNKDVQLSDGRRARVVLIHPHDPANPLVTFEEHFVDLSKEASLKIEKVFG